MTICLKLFLYDKLTVQGTNSTIANKEEHHGTESERETDGDDESGNSR